MEYIRQGLISALRKKGISSSSVLEAMASVPRHLFVSEALRFHAYDDSSLPIGHGQTISKPSVIATMVQSLGLTGDERVLEIGTGSGYQSAVLSRLADSLVTMERIGELINRARALLFGLGYKNIQFVHSGDFNQAEGMFDAVIVAAGADLLPVSLFDKLVPGGRLVIPVAGRPGHRIKKFVRKRDGSVVEEDIGAATFVPYVEGESA
ncbi:MAG: protein-L-isoaspartate(D-aspartate) O-methyltransferase [Spirochaetes bacterium]|nr:protein-L-isoaspartate(D-aspartate) O-methyltransferase [Spirochaetota bacterium]